MSSFISVGDCGDNAEFSLTAVGMSRIILRQT
jgi:hypothetical protein